MRALIFLTLLMCAGPAFAHGGQHYGGAQPGWTWDVWITAPLLIAGLLYVIGWRRLHGRAERGAAVLQRRAAFFLSGWLVLATALVSPLHEAGERSFAAHMFEHELLMLAAAPLLALSKPLTAMLWAFPLGARRSLGKATHWYPVSTVWNTLTGPVTATLLQSAALWLWHMPALFDRALASTGWHTAQHLSFLTTSLLFWTAMFDTRKRPDGIGVAALCLFATSVTSGALGALMAFSQSPWYRAYAELGIAPFGLSPVEDQQFAGLLMWVPGGLLHAVAALILVRQILQPDSDRRLGDAI
jgi:putative membrane protein